ncbi:phosphatase PAP2 family protein [Alteribacter natronophilus]|uniref:phosphatase PAP2 family protein n=1 Tax=Alteribacter natronophilus TaxID=2583810 RepID=UPI00110E984C|nr:phosphatase PAP2 family protein [Alteribacter natronophilus]TMW71802.1 phosphatase PAP2 family protein [Alteribacter natronophilus]
MKSFDWMNAQNRNVFRAINGCRQATVYHTVMGMLTHLGGAPATISITLVLLAAAPPEWRIIVLHSATALLLSHVFVTALKRSFRRHRPYVVIGESYVTGNPLQDSSFPSGHTTAVFSMLVPYMTASSLLIPVLLPVAVLVAISRITIGLHFPSDVIAGAMLGTTAAFLLGPFF